MQLKDDTILRICEVIDVVDDQGGLRIRVRIEPYDNYLRNSELPYCFPLLPKMFHVNPKKGESVLVLLTHIEGIKGNRFFVGPLISQQYNLHYDPHNYQARALLKGMDGVVAKPLKNPDLDPENEGSYPDREDIAVQGRKNSDLIFKDNEVRLRCGFLKNAEAMAEEALKFNNDDLSYIQMKYKERNDDNNKEQHTVYNSAINVVADRINLLTHDSKTPFRLNDKKELIDDKEMDKIMREGHPLPYGDELVSLLKDIREILLHHTHPFPMMQPVWREEYETKLNNADLDSILSQGIRIN